jgi:hypothetical protein
MTPTYTCGVEKVPGGNGHLACGRRCGHARRVDDEAGIYRGEVLELMGAVADIRVDVRRILWYIEGDDDEWEEEEEEEDPSGDA